MIRASGLDSGSGPSLWKTHTLRGSLYGEQVIETTELKQVIASLRRLHELDWGGVYRYTGFRWEEIQHLKAPSGAGVYSFRLSQTVRAPAFREGDFLRFISLHPDHDSAYRR